MFWELLRYKCIIAYVLPTLYIFLDVRAPNFVIEAKSPPHPPIIGIKNVLYKNSLNTSFFSKKIDFLKTSVSNLISHIALVGQVASSVCALPCDHSLRSDRLCARTTSQSENKYKTADELTLTHSNSLTLCKI